MRLDCWLKLVFFFKYFSPKIVKPNPIILAINFCWTFFWTWQKLIIKIGIKKSFNGALVLSYFTAGINFFMFLRLLGRWIEETLRRPPPFKANLFYLHVFWGFRSHTSSGTSVIEAITCINKQKWIAIILNMASKFYQAILMDSWFFCINFFV